MLSLKIGEKSLLEELNHVKTHPLTPFEDVRRIVMDADGLSRENDRAFKVRPRTSGLAVGKGA